VSSPTGSFDSVLTGLVYASIRKITGHNIDIKVASRNAILDELVYIEVSKGEAMKIGAEIIPELKDQQ